MNMPQSSNVFDLSEKTLKSDNSYRTFFVYFRSLFDELEQKWKSLDDVAENDPDFLQPYRFVSIFYTNH